MKKTPQPRPRYIAFIAASLDGRISLKKETPPSWTSPEDWIFFQKALAGCNAVVAGRGTYISAATRLRKRNTFVLTSRPKTLTRRGTVTFVNPKTVDLPSLLRSYKRVAIVGGGTVYAFMLEHGLLDEVFLTIEPLVFGRGKVMFKGGKNNFRMKLLSVRRLNRKGTLLVHYKRER